MKHARAIKFDYVKNSSYVTIMDNRRDWYPWLQSVLVTLYKKGEVYFRLLGTNGFHVKAESENFTTADSPCRQNLKCENFTSSFGRYVKKCTKGRATRAARLFFLI